MQQGSVAAIATMPSNRGICIRAEPLVHESRVPVVCPQPQAPWKPAKMQRHPVRVHHVHLAGQRGSEESYQAQHGVSRAEMAELFSRHGGPRRQEDQPPHQQEQQLDKARVSQLGHEVSKSEGWCKSRDDVVELLLKLSAKTDPGSILAGLAVDSRMPAPAPRPTPPVDQAYKTFAVASGDLASTHATCTRESLDAWDAEWGLQRWGAGTCDTLDRLPEMQELWTTPSLDDFPAECAHTDDNLWSNEGSQSMDDDIPWDELDKLRVAMAAGRPLTTLMVRGIPAHYTQEMLMAEWPLDGSYNLLYLPRSSGGRTNLGYAFLNFTTEAHARAFRSFWFGRALAHSSSDRRLGVGLADTQGFEATVAQLKAKPMGRMRSRKSTPVIVLEGRAVALDDL